MRIENRERKKTRAPRQIRTGGKRSRMTYESSYGGENHLRRPPALTLRRRFSGLRQSFGTHPPQYFFFWHFLVWNLLDREIKLGSSKFVMIRSDTVFETKKFLLRPVQSKTGFNLNPATYGSVYTNMQEIYSFCSRLTKVYLLRKKKIADV